MNKLQSILIVFSAFLASATAFAQNTVTLKINHFLNSNAFSFTQEASNNLSNKFNVKRLQYYISGVSIIHDGGQVQDASDVYILVNANQTTEVDIANFNFTKIEAIHFSVGVNSPQNNQDPTQWPATHALYPKSPSMHWGWSSGYRFVAMEGYGSDQLNKKYEIHSLGNEHYHKIGIPNEGAEVNGKWVIELNADYAKAVENINVASGVISHGSINESAVLLANFRDYVFTSTSGASNVLSKTNLKSEFANVTVSPNPSNGILSIQSDQEIKKISVFNAVGKCVYQGEKGITQVTLENPGVYFVVVNMQDGSQISKQIINN